MTLTLHKTYTLKKTYTVTGMINVIFKVNKEDELFKHGIGTTGIPN